MKEQHGILKCRECTRLISQCRCINHTDVSYGTCSLCMSTKKNALAVHLSGQEEHYAIKGMEGEYRVVVHSESRGGSGPRYYVSVERKMSNLHWEYLQGSGTGELGNRKEAQRVAHQVYAAAPAWLAGHGLK